MVALAGPLAMINCQPRQARKGATVAVTSCAGMWLVWAATLIPTLYVRPPIYARPPLDQLIAYTCLFF